MDEMAASAEDALPEMQGRVQRKLGRCILLLQQYERLMKAIISTHIISGPADGLHEVILRTTEKTQRKTMGQLLGELLGTFLVDASSQAAKDEEEEPNGRPNAEGAWVTIRCRISMESEQYAQTRLGLEQVVAMRNELVHHLSERFDLWTEEGCAGADAHLDECYGEIRRTYLRLRDISKASDAGRAEMAAFVNSQAGYDFIVDGIWPNVEGIDWARSTVVKLLRQAEEICAGRLDPARHRHGLDPNYAPRPDTREVRMHPLATSASRVASIRGTKGNRNWEEGYAPLVQKGVSMSPNSPRADIAVFQPAP